MKMPSPRTRRYLYGVLTAAVPILVAYGVIDGQTAPLWLAAGAAVLGTSLAAANTPAGGDES